MHSHLIKVSTNYRSLINKAKATEITICQPSVQALLVTAALLAAVAIFGYIRSGYQFAFMTINSLSPYVPDVLLENVTIFGDGIFLLTLILLFSCRNIQFHWTVLFTSLLGAIIVNLLKDYFSMPRPPAVLDPETFNLIGKAYKTRSFPSGHSLTAFLLATICFCYAKNWYLKTSFIVLAVMVALSRILLGVHWPMDVLVGGALGIVIGVAGMIITSKWKAGVCAYVHLFTLSLFVISCIVVFVEGNDYELALPLLYIVATAALLRLIRSYVLVR